MNDDLPPTARVMQILMGVMNSAAVSAIARLGIPDHLQSGPKTVEDLAHAFGAKPELLFRLMRATAGLGILAQTTDGKWQQTSMSGVLRSDATETLRHFACLFPTTGMSAPLEAPAIAKAYDFSGIRSLTDIGGGHGLFLATILERYPDMTGTLFELPQVVRELAGGPLEPFKDRVLFLEGDMFKSVPPGADAYIRKRIVHDWSDEQCGKIRHVERM